MELTSASKLTTTDKITGGLAATYRIRMFGNAGHSRFCTDSSSYIPIPDTTCAGILLPSPSTGAQRYYRIEVLFAATNECQIWLRSHDPSNEVSAWEVKFSGGQSNPNTWWNWRTTQRFAPESPNIPWQRQMQLEMKTECSDGAKLDGVWLIAEDIVE